MNTNKSGVCETIYGNACQYYTGDDVAFDLDSQEEIPVEAVDFSKFIRDIE